MNKNYCRGFVFEHINVKEVYLYVSVNVQPADTSIIYQSSKYGVATVGTNEGNDIGAVPVGALNGVGFGGELRCVPVCSHHYTCDALGRPKPKPSKSH